MKMRTLAKRLPGPVKQALTSAYGAIPPRLRLGRAFWQTYNFLEQSQWWDSARLEGYQMHELQRLLTHCYKQVPYYRRIFDERALKPANIQSLDDLKKLPYLRKEQIRQEPRAFVARNRRTARLQRRFTIGTSGQPLRFYVDRDELEREWAFAFHQWSRVGYRPGDARVEIRGQRIEGAKPYEWNPVLRVLRLSPVMPRKEVVNLYLETIRSHGIRFLYGYPSALTCFASSIKRYGLRVDLKLTAVLFASETLYPWQRTLAEDVFACRSYNFYGLAEHVVIAGECEASRAFHCIPQYGVTEVDPQTGEITGTGFLNHGNPFIRYRTTDIASLPVGGGCEQCGRQYCPVLPEIEGRLQDFIVTPEGMAIGRCVLTFPFRESRTIGHVQIVQESLDRVTLRAAPVDGGNSRQFTHELIIARAGLQRILGAGVSIESERIRAEEGAGPGKLRFIISRLPRDFRGPDAGAGM